MSVAKDGNEMTNWEAEELNDGPNMVYGHTNVNHRTAYFSNEQLLLFVFVQLYNPSWTVSFSMWSTFVQADACFSAHGLVAGIILASVVGRLALLLPDQSI